MAQAVEVLSVMAADRRLKEPRQFPRPGDSKREVARNAEGKTVAEATHGGLLTAALSGNRVRA